MSDSGSEPFTAPPILNPPPSLSFESQPALAHLQTDTLCTGCGYNLHGQPVREEPSTHVAMCRCPECGRFYPASEIASVGRQRLGRLMAWLLASWIVSCLLFLLLEGFIQFAIAVGTANMIWEFTQSFRHGGSSFHYGPTEYQLTIFFVIFGGVSVILAWMVSVAPSALALHLPLWARLLFPFIRCALLASLVYMVLSADRGGIAEFAPFFVLVFFGIHLVIGLLGVVLGRPFARLMVLIMVPRRARTHLAALWLVDGLEPPRSAPSDTP